MTGPVGGVGQAAAAAAAAEAARRAAAEAAKQAAAAAAKKAAAEAAKQAGKEAAKGAQKIAQDSHQKGKGLEFGVGDAIKNVVQTLQVGDVDSRKLPAELGKKVLGSLAEGAKAISGALPELPLEDLQKGNPIQDAIGEIANGAEGVLGDIQSPLETIQSIGDAASDLTKLGDNKLAQNALGALGKAGGVLGGAANAIGAVGELVDGDIGALANRAKDTVLGKAEGALQNAAEAQNTAAEKGTKEAAEEGGEKALKEGGEKLAKEGGEAALKAGGRFVPGANVAIAALDAKEFHDTLKDPDASILDKGAAGLTALGSAAAATNIPIVSQAGAVVSTVGDVIQVVDPDRIVGAVGDAANFVGDKVGDAADAVFDFGGDVVDTVKDTVNDAKEAVTDTVSDAADTVTDTVGDVADTAKDTFDKITPW